MNECAVVTKGWIVEGLLDGKKIHSRMYTVKQAADEYVALLVKSGATEVALREEGEAMTTKTLSDVECDALIYEALEWGNNPPKEWLRDIDMLRIVCLAGAASAKQSFRERAERSEADLATCRSLLRTAEHDVEQWSDLYTHALNFARGIAGVNDDATVQEAVVAIQAARVKAESRLAEAEKLIAATPGARPAT